MQFFPTYNIYIYIQISDIENNNKCHPQKQLAYVDIVEISQILFQIVFSQKSVARLDAIGAIQLNNRNV